jgi:hypothetical protein
MMTLQDTWSLSVEPRAFAEIVELPYWGRKLVSDPAEKPEGLARLDKKFSKAMYSLLYQHLGLTGAGRMKLGADRIDVPINGGHSVYVDYAGRSKFGGYEPVER